MSGILDNKSRVLDTIITAEGRRQLALGGVDIRYVTFTDGATFYSADAASGSQDATQRIYFESCQLPQDNVMFRADNDGNVTPFSNNSTAIPGNGGVLLDYSFNALTSSLVGTTMQNVTKLTGSTFTAAAQSLLGSSAENFNNLYLVASQNATFEDNAFAIGPDHVTFTIMNDRPISDDANFIANINSLDSLYSDVRFSNFINFRYLPPINKVSDTFLDKSNPDTLGQYLLGIYAPLSRLKRLSHADINDELEYYRLTGYMKTVNFDPTSTSSDMVGQFFETSNDSLRKLDVIEFGIDDVTGQHVFFVGKCEVDQNGTDTFLHIFTLIFK